MIDLGGKWLIKIIDAMPERGSRFTPLQKSLGISPSRLTENLVKLERLGFIKHLSPLERRHPLLPEYILTNQGLTVKRHLRQLGLEDLYPVKWAIPIMVCIYQGHGQFNEIKNILGITPKMLSNRLKLLVEKDYLEKRIISQYPIQIQYMLKDKTRRRIKAYFQEN